MEERRAALRQRVDEGGLISIDEHTSMGCMVHDVSVTGVRLTMPNTASVPDAFMLDAPCVGGIRVCRVAWRDDETIGAWFEWPVVS